ncbi:LysE family translocator [Streptomyces sp. T-3]|nr:LysE family translocator [Streptomyces sp. T-3]
MLSTLIAFLGACTLIAASPGPGTVLIIKQSLQSKRSGFRTVLGNETGVFIWSVVAAFGLTALLAASQLAYDVMRIVGAIVLVTFGAQALWQARRKKKGEAGSGEAWEAPRRSDWASYRVGLLSNIANPKAAIFAISFLPQFVPAGAPELPTMVLLGAIWAVYEVGYYGLYVWFVSRMKTYLSRAGVRRRLEQISGGVLVALGARMALES